MSEDDLAVMRRWLDAWNSADLDAFTDLFHPDAEVVTDPSWMEPGPFNGRDWKVRGRASGIETVLDATSVNRLKQGKIAQQRWYFDHPQALKAVGLGE
jgi:ketosteroid isomerase-like protein